MKKEGFNGVRRGNPEGKRKKTLKVFWKFRKDSYLCSPVGNGGGTKKDKSGRNARLNIADTEVEAEKVL